MSRDHVIEAESPEPKVDAVEAGSPQPAAETPAPIASGFPRAVVDQIQEPVFVKDRDLRWLIVNSSYCELVGCSEADLVGQPSSIDQVQAASEEDVRVLETGEPSISEESMVSADGRVHTCFVHRRLLRDDAGRLYVLGVVRDITELRQAEVALHESESRRHAERAQWEARLRKLKRGLLIQFSVFGVAMCLVAGLVLLLRTPTSPGRVFADEPAQTSTIAPVLAETHAPTTQPTATPANTATPSATPTLPPPQMTFAPTVEPKVSIINTDTVVVPPQPAPLRQFGPNVINVLLMGSDRRPGDQAWRTDVLILVSVDPDVPSVTMLSFPRDLWVYIPSWRWQRINLADEHGETAGFPGGGPALLKQTIQYNLGIPVHYYARVDFSGYKKLIDAVGGVDVVADCTLYDIFPDVPDGQNDIITGEALSTVLTGTIDIPIAGVYHLDGKHALWYSRSRKTTSDFDRSRRQQRVLRALWDEIQEQGVVSQLPLLWDSFTQAVETDLTLNDILYLADVGRRIGPAHIRSRFIDGTLLTWHVTQTGASVLLYSYDELRPYLDETFAPLPENVGSKAPASVDVQNGSSHRDWERVAADRLGWAGYNVSGWGPAAQPAEHTTIVDYTTTSKGSRLSALVELFQVAPENLVSQPDPNSPWSYRVIIGEDWEPCQRPSRGRWPAPPPATPAPEATPAP